MVRPFKYRICDLGMANIINSFMKGLTKHCNYLLNLLSVITYKVLHRVCSIYIYFAADTGKKVSYFCIGPIIL